MVRVRLMGMAAVTVLLLAVLVWTSMGLWYQLPGSAWLRGLGAGLWLVLGVTMLVLAWRGSPGLAVAACAVALTVFGLWWQGIAPSSTRLWAHDVERLPRAHIEGSRVTLENVRNFEWRSETDYDIRWETRDYDLDRLQSVDTALSYWMGPAIAHTLVSFGFDDGRHLTFSVEIRKERGESFSAVAGFFRQYETALIAADERDILRVRTNVRGEDVYLYRVIMPAEARRSLFLAYLAEAESLARQPRWYNSATANCTTIVFEMARRVVGRLPLDYRLLLSGYLPGYLHRVGALTPGFDLEALRDAGRITERARAAGPGTDFSRHIRRGIPGIDDGQAP